MRTFGVAFIFRFCFVVFRFSLFIFLLVGCRSHGREKKVVLYTDTPESLTLELAKLFEEKHGIKVEAVMEGTSWLMTRLRAERARPIADVFMGASGVLPGVIGAREGWLDRYVPVGWENLPEKEGKLWLRDREWKWVGFGFASLGLAYSLKHTTAEELPERWEDLSQPQWKSSLTIWDPSVSGTATLFLASFLQRARLAGRGEAAGWEDLRGFYRNLKKYAEEGPPAFLVAQGLVRLGVHLDNQFLYYRRKAKISAQELRFYLPEQSVILTDPVALVSGAPHPQEAKLLIDFFLSPSAQEILSRTFWVRSAAGELRLPSEHPYAGVAAAELLARALTLDIDWMANNFDRARIYWQNEIEE